MTNEPERKSNRAEQTTAIKAARGMRRSKPGEPAFTERMMKVKAEDRELERRRDERLAALIRK